MSPALNQSFLKQFRLPFDSFMYRKMKEEAPSRILFSEEGLHNIIGSAVDMKLTAPAEMYDETFFISSLEKKPSELIISIVQNVREMVKDNEELSSYPIASLRDYVLNAVSAHNYQPNWKEDTRINKVIDEGSLYYDELKLSEGKVIITPSDQYIIDEVAESIKRAFPNCFRDEDGFTVYHQLPIYFTLFEKECKALLDVVIVDHSTRAVIPFDVKTTAGLVSEFPSSFWGYGYDFQAMFYRKALQQKFPSYTIEPFNFLVESKLITGYADKFVVSDDTMAEIENGVPRLTSLNYCPDTSDIVKGRSTQAKISLVQVFNRYDQYTNYSSYSDLYESRQL